jgi:hypothetical protein
MATEYKLPPEKLRALVTLYDKTHKFITEDNLDAEIDRIFGNPQLTLFGPVFFNINELQRALRDRRLLPEMELRSEQSFKMNDKRKAQLKQALFGTEKNGAVGLPTLLDSVGVVDEREVQVEDEMTLSQDELAEVDEFFGATPDSTEEPKPFVSSLPRLP